MNRAQARPESVRAAEIRQQLERILANPAFSGANRRSRLLRYLVEQELEDHGGSLKESVIASEVFDRSPDYDPQIDSVVRVEVGRLRARLAEYYHKAGADEVVRIEIPRGGYRPVFEFRGEATAAPVEEKRRTWRPIAAGVAIVILLAALAIWRLRPAPPATPVAIAVLPFLNLSGDASDEYLSDGISEELTEILAEYNDVRVVSRTSAFQYKGKNADVREIGRNLRATAVLEGSVARRGGQLHVIAQLIRASDGYHLWSHTYDVSLAELPPAEAGIAKAAREKLAPSAPPGREMATTRSPEAHDLYIRAVYELNLRTEASTRLSIALAKEAAEKDASFAQPFVVMAAGESQLNTLLAQSPHTGAERAWADVAKALAIDPSNSGAHAQKAMLAYTDLWDWPQAEREFKLTLAAGSHGSAENLYGWCLMTRGRFEESRRRLQIAAELDPLSLGPPLNQVEESIAERNYPEARRKVEQILATAPTNFVALALATSAAIWQRDCPAAAGFNQKLRDAFPNSIAVRFNGAAMDRVCGRVDQGNAELADLLRHPPAGYVSPYTLAGAAAVAGDADKALAYLQKSADLREPVLMQVKVDRVFDPIRQDARFIALERKLGLLD